MSNLGVLLKTNLKIFIGQLKNRKGKTKYFSGGAMFVVLGIILIFSMTANAVGQVDTFIKMGVPSLALYSGLTYAMLLALILAVSRGTSTANSSSDADLLLSLPLTRAEILVSKSASKYIFEAIPLAVFCLPSIVVYFILVDNSIGMLLRGIAIFLLIPLFSVGISTILNFVMFKIGSKIKNISIFTTAFTIVTIVAFMFFNFKLTATYGYTAEEASAFFGSIKPIKWCVEFISDSKLAMLIPVLLLTVTPFVIGNALYAVIYGTKARTWRSESKKLEFTEKSPLKTLFHKELKRYLNCPIYLMNTIIGPIMLVAFGILTLFKDRLEFFSAFNAPEQSGYLLVIVVAAIGFCVGMTGTAASSISLEGKNLWLLKVLPVDTLDIFSAKILVNIFVAGPAAVFAGILSAIAIGLNVLEAVLLVLSSVALTVFVSVWGLYINLLFPKLDWENETVVVKQSMATFMYIFTDAIPVIIVLAVYVIFFISFVPPALMLAATTMFYLLLAAAVYALVRKDGVRRFKEL